MFTGGYTRANNFESYSPTRVIFGTETKQEAGRLVRECGGGSVIDTAKAIAYGLAEPEMDVWEPFAPTRTAKKCLPVASALTIAAAGSETSKGCVITNESTGEKRVFFCTGYGVNLQNG